MPTIVTTSVTRDEAIRCLRIFDKHLDSNARLSGRERQVPSLATLADFMAALRVVDGMVTIPLSEDESTFAHHAVTGFSSRDVDLLVAARNAFPNFGWAPPAAELRHEAV